MPRVKYFNRNTSNWEYADRASSGSGSGGNVELDTTLTVEGKAADAKAVGDALAASISGGTAAVIDYDQNVKSVNHRGYNTVAPENTIPAFILSRKNGFRYVECDVCFTSDGVCVLLHDSTIDRTSDGSGSISTMTYAEAAQYDYGSWKSSAYAGTHLPTLAEFLQTCKGIGLHPYIEIKDDSSTTQERVESIVSSVNATGMNGKVTYISFNATYLGYVKTVDPDARLGYVTESITEAIVTTATGLKADTNEVFIDCRYTNATDDAVSLCIAADIPLEVWTANTASAIESLNPYVSGVTSDSLIAGKVLYDKYIEYTAPGTPEVTLTSISATYSGGDVAVGTAVTDLTGIVVTAHYSDGTSETVTGYTLSGTISEGENIVTISYGGMAATITVTGVAEPGEDDPEEPVADETVISAEWEDGFINASGVENDNVTSGEMRTGYVPVVPGETVNFYNSNSAWATDWIGVGFYDADKAFVSRITNSASTDLYEFAIPENVYYMRVSSRNMTDYNATAVLSIDGTHYDVTNNLTYVTSSNPAERAESGTAYTATLTAADTVTVTMGGADITENVYANNVINIASVTGDIVITAVRNPDRDWSDNVITLHSDEITYGVAPNANAEGQLENASRAGYLGYDIPAEYGYIYRFDFVATVSTAKIAVHVYNDTTVENQANGVNNSNSSGIKDYGWQSSGYELEMPETINSVPVNCIRLVFKQYDTSNAVTEGFIKTVTITRTAV